MDLPLDKRGIITYICGLKKIFMSQSLSKFLEEIKRNSSRWIKTKNAHYKNFAWQGGYSGYSVSESKVETVKRYIENQKEHHKKTSFKDEYLKFLKEYGVSFNENYLWE